MNYASPAPWKHQLVAIEMGRDNPNLALFHEMGTGKTRTTIEILREECAIQKRLVKTLILGPVIVVRNWQNEIKKFSKIKAHDVVPLVGAAKKRVARFNEATLDPVRQTATRARIFITNYEAMQMEELVDAISKWQPEILICDEAHRLKNPKSTRARAVVRIADLCRRRVLLTGTPILNSVGDIFNQYRILDAGQTFSVTDPRIEGGRRPMNFWEFQGIYMEDLNRGMPSQKYFPKWVPRCETYEELNNKIYKKAHRVLKSECLDLPPLIRQRIDVELGPEQTRIYREMRDQYIAWIKEHEHSGEPRAVVAQMALTKALRLQQIISGYAKTEDGKEIQIKQNPRLDELAELLSQLTPNHKVLVWATFKDNYRQIAEVCQKLKVGYVEIHGGVTAKGKDEAVRRFREDHDVRVVIGNQGAAGIGINLVEASYSIFYSRNFSLEQDLQAEARNYRGGSEIHQKVTRIDLVAPETIDELILQALADKQNLAETILDWKDKL